MVMAWFKYSRQILYNITYKNIQNTFDGLNYVVFLYIFQRKLK